MNERPGRKALFTGVLPGILPAGDPSKEIAAHVRQLNDDIAAALSSAVAGKPAGALDPSKFGVEYSTLIAAVNSAFAHIKSAPPPAVPVVPAGISSEKAREYEQTITDLEARLRQATAAAMATDTATGAGISTDPSRQYKLAIADLEHRLELMVEKNPVPLLLTTPSFLITEANAAYVAMSGIKSEELKNTSLTKFHILGQKGEGAKVAIHEKRRSFGEVTVELPSGIHVLEQYCIPVIAGDGTITSLMFVYNDITVQKKKNEEIEQLRYRSETIVKENPIPMLMTNAGFVVAICSQTRR